MYQGDEEEENKPIAQAPAPEFGTKRTRKVRVGAVEYELPTVEYVQQLEQLVHQQARMLEQHRRAIGSLHRSLTAASNAIRRQKTIPVTPRDDL